MAASGARCVAAFAAGLLSMATVTGTPVAGADCDEVAGTTGTIPVECTPGAVPGPGDQSGGGEVTQPDWSAEGPATGPRR